MNQKQKMIPLQELHLTDRFLFAEVMEDETAHQAALSIILGKEIPLLNRNETEKEFRVSPLTRSVRMDVFAIDENNTVYNTEMQKIKKNDLAKRSRYYQSLLDTSLLEPGIPNYNLLYQTYQVLITPFDLFGYGKYRYTFKAACEEVPGCLLEDGATRIFLNTKGENDEDISEELREFLHYLEETTDERAAKSGSPYIQSIHRRVCQVKTSEEIGVKYMQAWEERYYEKEEALKLGERTAISRNLLSFLEELGEIPEVLRKKISEEEDLLLLQKWLKLAAKAASIEDFEEKALGEEKGK